MAERTAHKSRSAFNEAGTRVQRALREGAKSLSLANLGLSEVPESLAQLTRLEALDLSSNQLTHVPKPVHRLWHLQKLYLEGNRLKYVAKSLSQLAQLQELCLDRNGLVSIPEILGHLSQLRVLSLSSNRLASLPETLGQLIQLQVLSLHNNLLTSVPDALGGMTELRELYLYDNRLTSLPEALGQLTQLQALYVYNNQLASVPKTLGQLIELQKLSLYNNRLTSLPETVGQLTHLRELYAYNNQLTSIPEALGQLSQLRKLHLSYGQLTSIPRSLGQLTELQELDLSHNQLTSIPETLGQLTQLQELDLSDNQLTSVPEALGRLAQLQELDLSNNQLTSIRETLGQLTQLRRFSVRENRLASLPESLGQLTQLESLDLSDNQLMSVPESLRELTGLRELYLHGNSALGLPAEVLGPTRQRRARPAKPGKILDYYFRVRVSKRPLNEAKLILVGRGGVGKTSLVNRLLSNRFDPKETKTEGICISEWKLSLRGEEVRLHLWDFGGQEIMHATHQFFLTQRSLYLLVLEGRQGAEDADAEYWLKLIESFGTESSGDVSPVLIVLNKTRENPFDLNRRALQQKYPFISGFIATDCKVPIGIDELRTAVERETDQLKHLRDAFPSSWFAIKDRLAAMEKNFITFEQYREMCAAEGENESAAQDSLAFYLHSLGIALNFRDDPRLRDTHVLNPDWVTNGIYKVLNSALLAQRKGELHLEDVTQILDAAEYPRSMHRFLFDLMKKFELCFTFPDDDARYLVPELLDKQEAIEAAEFQPAECLNFEYRYPVLPEGLLPRFIVRTHALSSGQPRWRTGVVLAFEGNRALVKADVQDKRVCIAVAGPVTGRRRLLAVIRSDFERIHADISKLRPEAFVPVPEYPRQFIPYEDLLVMEREGESKFKKPIEGRLVDIDVQELLTGVDLEGTRKREDIPSEQPMRLFYSYSHKDETLRDELETHLKILERRRLIAPWHDRKIMAGEKWEDEIDENLERADIILLLVSADFVASNYCWEKEMTRALEQDAAREATVVPVIVRDVNWSGAPFAKLQALPEGGKAVELWPNRDSAWRSVSEGIERIVLQIRAKSRGNRMG